MPLSFLKAQFGAVVCPGSSSCSRPSHCHHFSFSRNQFQLTRGRLASAPVWKQLEAPEESLRQGCVCCWQANTNPRVPGQRVPGSPGCRAGRDGEGWVAAGVHRQVNGSRGCCTIGFHLPAS